jgi:hypothetical protein
MARTRRPSEYRHRHRETGRRRSRRTERQRLSEGFCWNRLPAYHSDITNNFQSMTNLLSVASRMNLATGHQYDSMWQTRSRYERGLRQSNRLLRREINTVYGRLYNARAEAAQLRFDADDARVAALRNVGGAHLGDSPGIVGGSRYLGDAPCANDVAQDLYMDLDTSLPSVNNNNVPTHPGSMSAPVVAPVADNIGSGNLEDSVDTPVAEMVHLANVAAVLQAVRSNGAVAEEGTSVRSVVVAVADDYSGSLSSAIVYHYTDDTVLYFPQSAMFP